MIHNNTSLDRLLEYSGYFFIGDIYGDQVSGDFYDSFEEAADAISAIVASWMMDDMSEGEKDALYDNNDWQIVSVDARIESKRYDACRQAKLRRIRARSHTTHVYATIAGWDRGVKASDITDARNTSIFAAADAFDAMFGKPGVSLEETDFEF